MGTDLVYHIGQLALDFIRINLLFAAEIDGSGELGNSNSGAPRWRHIWRFGLRLLEAACDEDLAQQVPQTDIMRSFQG